MAWKDQLTEIQKLRDERRVLDDKRYAAQINLQKTENELRKSRQGETGTQPVGELEKQQKKLQLTIEAATADLKNITDKIGSLIKNLYVEPHPRKSIGNLNDSIPFLLLPVKIETRFMTIGSSRELWVRVYPDDIAIQTHEAILTDGEVPAGESYWKNVFTAIKKGGASEIDQRKGAWRTIAASVGAQRAAWVTKQTQPTNWHDINNINSEKDLKFPKHEVTKTSTWTRAPRTHLMPDRFVVMCYIGDSLMREVTGNIIPDELVAGADPMMADEAFTNTANGNITAGDSYNWSTNFDKAVEMGMGFKIPLNVDEASRGFDKVLVLGVYLSADETTSQQAVETLIDNHHYAAGGFGLVTQGTPTNNTDQEGSGFSENDPFHAASFAVEAGDPLFTAKDDCDGRNLAHALGIDYTPLQHIQHTGATDNKEAMAMNTALYPATLGYYFDTMLAPVLNDANQDQLRDFFIKNVSGRGPLPTIRAGNQPYGILLTSDFSRWQWQKTEPGYTAPFLGTLYAVLQQYNNFWNSILHHVQYVGKEGADPSQVLMNILGLQPGSVSFYQRTGYSTDDLWNRDGFEYGDQYYQDIKNSFTSKNIVLNFLSNLGYQLVGPDGQLRVPQLLRLVYQHYHTLLDATNLIDNIPLSEKNGIRDYGTTAGKNYLHWLLEADSLKKLEQQDFGTDVKAPTALLYLQLRRALLLQLNKASVRWFGRNNILLDQVLQPMNFHNIRPAGNVTKWEVMKANIGHALPDHPHNKKPVAEHLLTTGKDEVEAAYLNSIKDALQVLSNKPTARLERCFTEHLDTCSYRLDAWQGALFYQRLQTQREVKYDGEQVIRKKGIYVGAFGWVENLKPDTSKQLVPAGSVPASLHPANVPLYEYTSNGGFVHAPSLNQASAAAVLRSGYLSRATSAQPDTYAVNLSSERVRRAMFIMQGIRNGQSLEALLGYQFERGLHDRASQNDDIKILNAFIYDFRDVFTIEQHYVQQQGAGTVTETIPANNVVNGLTLSESTLPYPYGVTLNLGGLSNAQKLAIQQAIEAEKNALADSLDAIKDLLMSESVYQLVQGNADRTGAVMNALKEAQLPPEIDVIQTPRSSHFSFTNRVTIQFETLTPASTGYNPWPAVPMTPRAVMEAGVNKWLHKVMGAPENLVCTVSHTDAENNEQSTEVSIDQLQVQPIDLLYMAGQELNTGIKPPDQAENNTGASELESRIVFYYRKLKGVDEQTPVRISFMQTPSTAGKKALGRLLPLLKSLKAVVTSSRALHAEDFDPPSKASAADSNNPKAYDAADLLNRIQLAATAFNDSLATLQAHLPAVPTDPLDDADAQALQHVLIQIADFGQPDAFPQVTYLVTGAQKAILLQQAKNTEARMIAIQQQVNELLTTVASLTGAADTEKKIMHLTTAGKLLFNEAFTVLPLFTYNNATDILQSHADRAQLLKFAGEQFSTGFVAEEWMQQAAHVRPRLAQWEYIRTLHESLQPEAETLGLLPVQVPYRSKDSWLAVEFPETFEDGTPFNITHDTLSITVHGATSAFTNGKQSGLLVDDWTETIPVKEEITGITFNYNQPNATAPQALLLAVAPKVTGKWSWDDLVGILHNTLNRAKQRAVEPALLDTLSKPEVGVMLPALLANFSQYDLDIALDYRMNVAHYANTIPVLPVNASN
jgi:hypothetical protein